ncbi:hypothetical protein trd_A0483 (plasmid) [Thermomicrobium roseum DSM 5159]|uniref:Uncharacterized protein n=1 Tax=Thermomicrobium roseum (strain ATCC 27502 / DSM 5159 / P-2) TaxID=309801 RepID=B9L3W8_THERP|nr:hypothetical protein trd_A0483 [Thermomicrobium roseum DSM 5159]
MIVRKRIDAPEFCTTRDRSQYCKNVNVSAYQALFGAFLGVRGRVYQPLWRRVHEGACAAGSGHARPSELVAPSAGYSRCQPGRSVAGESAGVLAGEGAL